MPSGASPHGTDPLWVALILLLALFVGTVAGVLGWLSGQPAASAILTSGVAFGGTTTLAILILNAVRGAPPKG
jgi:hypothetical protein